MTNEIELYIERYSWVLNVALVVLLALSMAKTTNAFVRNAYTPAAKVEAWIPPQDTGQENRNRFPISLSKIEERNIFGAKIREEVAAESSAPVEVNYNLCIQGLISGDKWKMATLLNKDSQKVIVVGLGDEIGPGATVADVLPDKVVIAYANGKTEDVLIDYGEQRCQGGAAPGARPPTTMQDLPRRDVSQPPSGLPPPQQPQSGEGIQAVSETEFLIDKAFFDSQMSDLNARVSEARMVPNFTPDRQVDGFRIFQIVPNSIFQKLGLRNGDVIVRVNGVKMDDPTKGLELFQMLKNESQFTIDVKRHNNPMTMNYSVK